MTIPGLIALAIGATRGRLVLCNPGGPRSAAKVNAPVSREYSNADRVHTYTIVFPGCESQFDKTTGWMISCCHASPWKGPAICSEILHSVVAYGSRRTDRFTYLVPMYRKTDSGWLFLRLCDSRTRPYRCTSVLLWREEIDGER